MLGKYEGMPERWLSPEAGPRLRLLLENQYIYQINFRKR